jgi:hypothetical protein
MPRDPRAEEFIPADIAGLIRDYMSPERTALAAEAAEERDRAFRDSLISLANRVGEIRGAIAELHEDIGVVREQGNAQFRELKVDVAGVSARVTLTEADLKSLRDTWSSHGMGRSAPIELIKHNWGGWLVLVVLAFVAGLAFAFRR